MTSQLSILPSRPESVLMGKDSEAIEILLSVHAPESPRILDVTHNAGKMWKGCSYRPAHTMDINPAYEVDTVGDFKAMPFEDASYSAIVFDPPHLPNAHATNGRKTGHADVYGTRMQEAARSGDNISALFAPFLAEAKRVLEPQGIVLAKLRSTVHNHRAQWEHVEFVNAVRAASLTPCDELIIRHPAGGNLSSSKWKNVRHLRRVHSYWIVVRKGQCEARSPVRNGASDAR